MLSKFEVDHDMTSGKGYKKNKKSNHDYFIGGSARVIDYFSFFYFFLFLMSYKSFLDTKVFACCDQHYRGVAVEMG